jgi:hypothetical protein
MDPLSLFLITNKSSQETLDFALENKQSVLIYVCFCEHASVDVIKCAMEKDNIDYVDKTVNIALTYLCVNEGVTLEKIQCMIEKADRMQIKDSIINFKNLYHNTPLMHACSNKFVTLPILKYIINNGADVNSKSTCGQTALFWLCANESITIDMLVYMIESGADTNVFDDCLDTAFLILCANKSVTLDMLKCFKDVSLTHKNNNGDTPLILLCKNESVTSDILEFIVKKCSKTTIKKASVLFPKLLKYL